MSKSLFLSHIWNSWEREKKTRALRRAARVSRGSEKQRGRFGCAERTRGKHRKQKILFVTGKQGVEILWGRSDQRWHKRKTARNNQQQEAQQYDTRDGRRKQEQLLQRSWQRTSNLPRLIQITWKCRQKNIARFPKKCRNSRRPRRGRTNSKVMLFRDKIVNCSTTLPVHSETYLPEGQTKKQLWFPCFSNWEHWPNRGDFGQMGFFCCFCQSCHWSAILLSWHRNWKAK